MSNFSGKAVNPKTGKEETVAFLDNYYGPHEYAVKFLDGSVYPASKIQRVMESE